MKKLSFPIAALSLLASCTPVTQSQAPTKVTTSATYVTGPVQAGADNPVLAAVVASAPLAPTTASARQPWRAEEIERNSVVLRSNPTSINAAGFSLANYPQEMSWNVISLASTTTVTATYSSAYAAAAQYIFTSLDKQFIRAR